MGHVTRVRGRDIASVAVAQATPLRPGVEGATDCSASLVRRASPLTLPHRSARLIGTQDEEGAQDREAAGQAPAPRHPQAPGAGPAGCGGASCAAHDARGRLRCVGAGRDFDLPRAQCARVQAQGGPRGPLCRGVVRQRPVAVCTRACRGRRRNLPMFGGWVMHCRSPLPPEDQRCSDRKLKTPNATTASDTGIRYPPPTPTPQCRRMR